jgi:hypothetical protein
MNVLANPKGSVGRWNLNFWRLEQFYHKFLKQGCCRHLFLTHRLIQNKQRKNCEATEMMARKVHVYFKIWEFHLVTPPKCQKLPSSIPKTAHVKFRSTSNSLSTTLWCYYRGHNYVVVMNRCLYLSGRSEDCHLNLWSWRSWSGDLKFSVSDFQVLL